MAFSRGTSENSILFFQGGHKHDGLSSSLIDVTKYSIYDFIVGKTGDSSRQAAQQKNYDSLKGVISSIITTDILGPSGVRLGPNSVQSVNIAAGAITASELSADIVLVNNVIRSNNFDGNIAANGSITTSGTVGWAISGDGTAVFDTSYIRGTITAGAVSTPGVDILANGAIVSNNFSVTANGVLSATSANISGAITATSGAIAGWDITGDNLTSGGGYAGNMIIGPGYSPGGSGSVYINTPSGTPGIDSIASHTGLYSAYYDEVTSNGAVTNGTVIKSTGISYQYDINQLIEFWYDSAAGLLYAYINGTPYCITECGSTPPAPVGVTPVGVSPTAVSPTAVSPTGVSPTAVSPTGVAPAPLTFLCTWEQAIYGVCNYEGECTIFGGGEAC